MCNLQIQYVRAMEEEYRSATLVTAPTRLAVKVRRFFRLVRAEKYVDMYIALFTVFIDFSVFLARAYIQIAL